MMKKASILIITVFTCWSCISSVHVVNPGGLDTRTGNGVHFRLDGRSGRFSAKVGIDDCADTDSLCAVIFYVFTNKDVAFNSGIMKKGDVPEQVRINLKGVTDLYLVAESASGNHANLHARWTDAVFDGQTPPVTIKDNMPEERYILTPPPSPKPRINGAKITGASPGKPFLFAIAASGERPMKFSAENLPEGLFLDKKTGIITGLCNHAGVWLVPVNASNDKGACNDTLEIVMGGQLALTPYMGWNSWYIYATGVTQDIMEKSAQAMHDEGLVNFGYTYVNIDDGWEVKSGSDDSVVGGPVRDADGTIRTNRNFPDMRHLTDYVHGLGMKAGLYSSPGRTTCGGYTGSFGYEALDVKTFSDWGFDFLKYDWCSYANEVKSANLEELQKPYRLISKYCRESNRDMVLNLCQYGMGDVWKWGKDAGGNSWRTTGDIGDTGNLLASMFRIGFFQEQLKNYAGPGGWNDPDYLLFGDIYDWDKKMRVRSPYSASEHYTCMTLWCMMSAPLIFSGDVTALDDFTKNVLCNAEVISIDQDKAGKPGYCIQNSELIEIWKKDLTDGSTAIAVFNKRPLDSRVELNWEELGYAENNTVRDLWKQKDLGIIRKNRFFDIPRHGCVLLKIRG